MAGLPTTGSSAEWARLFPKRCGATRSKSRVFRAAGAIVLGKTAADDFAYRGNGRAATPDRCSIRTTAGTRTPGGSSAGSAVAVASGMAFAALGTDDGGSNRIPAQFTGVVGMKPTFGLVPRTGVIPTWPYLDTHGPLARTVADAALLLSAIAGPDGRIRSRSQPHGMVHRSPRSATTHSVECVWVWSKHTSPRAQMSAEAVAMWDRAVGDLRAAGANVEPFDAAVTRVDYRDAFAAAASKRGDVAVNANSPAPTANALLRYFAGRTGDRAPPCVADIRHIESFTTCCRRRMRSVNRCSISRWRMTRRDDCLPVARRGRCDARSVDAHGWHRGNGLSDDAVQRAARRGSVAGYSNGARLRIGLGCRRFRFPLGWGRMGCRRSTCRSWGCLVRTRGCWRWRTGTSDSRAASWRRHGSAIRRTSSCPGERPAPREYVP